MRIEIILKGFIWFSILFMAWSCQKSYELSFPQVITPVLDFNYRSSTHLPGFIQFVNLSKGYKDFEWKLGVKNINGKEHILIGPSVSFTYAAPGMYDVTLTAIDSFDWKSSISKPVLVN